MIPREEIQAGYDRMVGYIRRLLVVGFAVGWASGLVFAFLVPRVPDTMERTLRYGSGIVCLASICGVLSLLIVWATYPRRQRTVSGPSSMPHRSRRDGPGRTASVRRRSVRGSGRPRTDGAVASGGSVRLEIARRR